MITTSRVVEDMVVLLKERGVDDISIGVDPAIFENLDMVPGKFLRRYKDRPEFDESFFEIN